MAAAGLLLCFVGTVRSFEAEVMCEHSACMESGSPDADCCAVSADGGCSAGFNYFPGKTCYTPTGMQATCCLPDTCVKDACLEGGKEDSDCCGLDEDTSCLPPYEKQLGDECWSNGARRTCCVLPEFSPLCEHDQCLESGAPDANCCAVRSKGGCGPGFTYFTGSICNTPTNAEETCCVSDAMCDVSACMLEGFGDTACCGPVEETSCKAGYTRIVGDICLESNGDRRICCAPDKLAGPAALGAQQEVVATGVPRQPKSILLGAGVASAFVLVAGAYVFVKRRRRYDAPASKEPLME